MMDNKEKAKKALIAMSGGVDSSVAAAIMSERDFECMGCTMRLYENDMIGEDLFSTCCSLEDTKDARSVCETIGIPYQIIHYEAEFKDKVIEPFVQSYERGETPNPCIDCNRHLKFESLYNKAFELGYEYIVTGHYAIIEEKNGHFFLKKAKDLSKDQSYVLYNLTEEQLAHTFFPLGDYEKTETRQIAERFQFINSKKDESQDICFVPDGDYAGMICRYRNREYEPGDFVDENGNVLGRHKGIINYTIGQRRGLGIPAGDRLYVKRLDVPNNRVVLSDNESLKRRALLMRDFHRITKLDTDTDTFRCTGKIRYRHKDEPAIVITGITSKDEVLNLLKENNVTPEDFVPGALNRAFDELDIKDAAVVIFDEPVRAITPGQSVVLYDGDYVIGGGITHTSL